MTLDSSDQALVRHMHRQWTEADEPTRVRLEKINTDALATLHADRRRLLSALLANERAIELREAIQASDAEEAKR